MVSAAVVVFREMSCCVLDVFGEESFGASINMSIVGWKHNILMFLFRESSVLFLERWCH